MHTVHCQSQMGTWAEEAQASTKKITLCLCGFLYREQAVCLFLPLSDSHSPLFHGNRQVKGKVTSQPQD
jgi:hypothetical protein